MSGSDGVKICLCDLRVGEDLHGNGFGRLLFVVLATALHFNKLQNFDALFQIILQLDQSNAGILILTVCDEMPLIHNRIDGFPSAFGIDVAIKLVFPCWVESSGDIDEFLSLGASY